MRFLLMATQMFLVLVGPLLAQTSRETSETARIDAILAGGSITVDQAAWLVGRTVGVLEESASADDTAQVAARWGLAPTAPGTPLAADAFAHLLVEAEGIPAGLFYSLFPGPRYAFRELVYLRVFPPGLRPDALLSGADAMLYLQNTQNWKEAHP